MPGEPVFHEKRYGILIALALFLLLGSLVYRDILCKIILSVLAREESSHGILVPFISAFFLWEKRTKLLRLPPVFSPLPGSLVMAAGFLVLYLAGDTTGIALPALSFLMVMAGVIIAVFGTRIFREVSFPFLLLISIIPLPWPVYNTVAEYVRSITTAGSTFLVQVLGVPLIREGYSIYLPGIQLEVAESCSGIRYLVSFFVFGLAYAFYFKNTWKGRMMVLLATFPISILGGVIRLATIFLATYYIGVFMAGDRVHVVVSWFVFAAILLSTITFDRKFFKEKVCLATDYVDRY